MSELSEETKTIATIVRHQKQVSFLLRELARELERRADLHDMSKLEIDELEGFVDVNQIARQFAFGSPKYNDSLKENNAIDLHFSRNSHHPEYHTGGVSAMGFIDFTEMVCDWVAANKTYKTTSWEDALKEQQRRFHLSNCQLFVIHFIAEALGHG